MAARRLRPDVAPRRSAACDPDGRSTPSALAAAAPGRLDEIQRARLLAAAVDTIDELGYAGATVAQITARARVSRRTFYELFDNREECFAAILAAAAARATSELCDAELEGLAWCERMRLGLWMLLCFLERDLALARVCLVHSLRGTGPVLERREEIVATLIAAVDEGRHAGNRAAQCGGLTAEGVVGASLTILQTRLTRGAGGPLTELLGELTGMIVLPYLGLAAARRETQRPALARPTPLSPRQPRPLGGASDAFAGVRMRLTYRTARVLEEVGTHPGASNSELAARAGIHDQGQVSKLLARLERLELLVNRGKGQPKGEPNAWHLTPAGVLLARSVTGHTRSTNYGRVVSDRAPSSV
jgi:AcrR family transcriptional regulator